MLRRVYLDSIDVIVLQTQKEIGNTGECFYHAHFRKKPSLIIAKPLTTRVITLKDCKQNAGGDGWGNESNNKQKKNFQQKPVSDIIIDDMLVVHLD